jgi:hypothetical protein
MVDPGWAVRTPDENDLILKAGTGPATTLAALATYLAEVASVEATTSMSMVNMAATNATWQGAANVASTTTLTSINTVAHLLAGWLVEKPPILSTAVSAYTTAYSAMIPAALCVANREEWASFCALNSIFPPFFMPAIVDRDREYFGHFWPNNTTTGSGYSATLVSLMAPLAVVPPITPPGASPGAPAAAAAAVAQSTATGVAGDAMRASSEAATQAAGSTGSGTDMVSKIGEQALQPLQQAIGVLPKAFESVAGLPEKLSQPLMSAMQSFGGMMGGAKGGEAVPGAAEALRAGGGAGAPTGLGPTAGAGGGGGIGGGGAGVGPGAAGMTSYTRPVSSFAPEAGGRATGLRSAGLLNAAEARIPTTTGGGVGGGMPMGSAGMLGRQQGDSEQESVTRARIVVNGEVPEQRS